MSAGGGTSAATRWIGVAGMAFCTLLLVSLVLVNPPEADRSDTTILDYYADSGNRAKEYGSAILAGLALIALIAFLTGLRELLAQASDQHSILPNLAFAGGFAFALLLTVGAAVMTAVTAAFEFSDEFELNADTARLMRTFGFLWLPGFAAMTASLLVACTSLVGRRTGLLPSWLVWVGLVVSVLLLGSIPLLGFGTFVAAFWVLAASLVLVIRGARPGEVQSASEASARPSSAGV